MPERETPDGVERQCRFCLDWWPLDFFTRAKDCRGGRSSQCQACWRDRVRTDGRKRREPLPRGPRPVIMVPR